MVHQVGFSHKESYVSTSDLTVLEGVPVTVKSTGCGNISGDHRRKIENFSFTYSMVDGRQTVLSRGVIGLKMRRFAGEEYP